MQSRDLFVKGKFTSHSGLELDTKIDCDSFNIREMRAIAHLLNQRIDPFYIPIGIPSGGNALAKCMETYATKDPSKPFLLCDDVYTTGKSMEGMRIEIPNSIGAVIFARYPTPDWITPLFSMTPPFYAGVPAHV